MSACCSSRFRSASPRWCKAFNKGMADSTKPKVMVALGDTWPLASRCHGGGQAKARRCSRARRIACCARSRSIPATAACSRARASPPTPAPFPGLPKLGKGTQPEWLGKKVLAAAGIRVPDGELARTPDEAAAVAKRIGYPVALKAQAAALSHKTEAGGVMLNLADEAALRAAWDTMQQNVKRAAPGRDARRLPGREDVAEGPRADGRRQARSGLGHGAAARASAASGSRRWATCSCCRSTRTKRRSSRRCTSCARRSCSPASAARRRRTSKRSRRSSWRIGRLMQTVPDIVEIDVNPLMVHAKGQGVTALDALIVAE